MKYAQPSTWYPLKSQQKVTINMMTFIITIELTRIFKIFPKIDIEILTLTFSVGLQLIELSSVENT